MGPLIYNFKFNIYSIDSLFILKTIIFTDIMISKSKGLWLLCQFYFHLNCIDFYFLIFFIQVV